MNWYHRWYCGSGRWERRLRDGVLPWALAGVDLGDHALEIGPGPGKITRTLMQRAERLTSIEVDPRLARALEARLAGTNVTVVEGDATSMPFEDGTFSSAVSLFMLHHVPSSDLQDALIAETFRVLRPGATFAGADSTPTFSWRLAHVLDTCQPVDPASMEERLQAAGFMDVKVSPARDAFRFRATRPAAPDPAVQETRQEVRR